MHTIVVDLGFGDAGKGTVVDYLCHSVPEINTVVRFSGGAQAAHNVVLPNGTHHTFAQFGSGTLAGADTYLSQYMMINLLNLENEANKLSSIGIMDPYKRLTASPDCLLTTPYHVAYNRHLEQSLGASRHGSCGQGIGATKQYSLENPVLAPKMVDIHNGMLRAKLEALDEWLYDTLGLKLEAPDDSDSVVNNLHDRYIGIGRQIKIDYMEPVLDRGPCVFEGSQGVLLDEWYGFHPYTTWSTTTFENALDLLGDRPAKKLGVVRSYTTRHGPGPMPTEDPSLAKTHPEWHNHTGQWMGDFRVGHFDAVATAYAIEVCGGVDGLAITHLDTEVTELRTQYFDPDKEEYHDKIHVGYKHDLSERKQLTKRLMKMESVPTFWLAGSDAISEQLGVDVWLRSFGPTHQNKTSTSELF